MNVPPSLPEVQSPRTHGTRVNEEEIEMGCTDLGGEASDEGGLESESVDGEPNFDYRSVFVQPKSSTLGSCPDRFMKCFYNKVRFSCLYCWVFACGVPWVFYLALMNATIIWLYTWVLFPLSKMFDFLLKKVVRVFYSLVGDLVGPFGDCIINWLGMFCGHKCPILAKRMKKAKQIIKISEA